MRLGALGCHTKKGCLQEVGFEEFKNNDESHCYTTNSFVKKNDDGDTKLLLSLIPFIPPAVFAFLFMSL
jgi:hypothetical protein